MSKTPSTGELPLVVILGATAVGKTGTAVVLTQRLNGEIISADSRQIYRRMDIGTAKPTPEQRAEAAHHLIDVVDPDENLSLAQFQRLAYAAIEDVRTRGRLPLLVGGTGQYITALVEGWRIPEVPPNPTLRAELETYAAAEGADALHARLRQLDPDAAARIDHRNIRRVVRALEIVIETGEPMDYEARRQPPPYPIFQHGLTLERQALYTRADLRIDQMIAAGFVDEVRRLLEAGYSPRLPSMSALGYKEIAGFLAGTLSLDEAVAAMRTATHDFIRRQYTWFNGHDSGVLWHDMAQTDLTQLAALLAAQVAGKTG